MKKIFTKIALLAMAVLLVGGFASCKHKGFKKADAGYYYKFHVENEDSAQVQMGDLLLITHTIRTEDSTLIENYPLQLLVREHLFEGDLYDALLDMHKGDSATLILNLDSFALYYFQMEETIEPELKERDLYIDIKIQELMPAAEFEEMQQQQQAQYEAMVEQFRLSEDSLLTDYLNTNKIKAKPTESGLIYVKKSNGKGLQAETGKAVSFHYTGKLLDGTVFDSSEGRDPLTITLGAHNVIPGMEEGLAMMKEGEKATLIMPSKVAYGENGAGGVIPPYTTIVFDVELVKVMDAPAAAPTALAE